MTTDIGSDSALLSDWRVYPDDSLPPILEAALECFVDQGYHGTTIRTVAASANLSVPGLYHHYSSKQDLLVAIVDHAMAELWERSVRALQEAGDRPERRLDLLIECLVLFHAHRRKLAFIAASEIRSLVGDARIALIAARDRQQRLMDQALSDGVAQGVFTTPLAIEASRALVTMCTGVAQWYRHDGPMTPDELARDYILIARMTAGCEV
ncbi:MAG: TetR/AcrR family transcriptional regulator [Mycetocola sp.]